MPRLSRGCLRCRQRRVRCDEGRPSCQRCLTRDEMCVGYRDESDLIFRHETAKFTRPGVLRDGPPRNSESFGSGRGAAGVESGSGSGSGSGSASPSPWSTTSLARSVGSSSSSSSRRARMRSSSVDSSRPSTRGNSFSIPGSSPPSSSTSSYSSSTGPAPLNSKPGPRINYPWLKKNQYTEGGEPTAGAAAATTTQTLEDEAVSGFFDRYVLYPCSQSSAPGFLEHLPSLFMEVNVEGHSALRFAVQAAGLADASRTSHDADHSQQQQNRPPRAAMERMALDRYGQALSALARSLGKEKSKLPDDFDLMTVVVLDIFETLFLPDDEHEYLSEDGGARAGAGYGSRAGSHAQGMAHILRLRGHEQFHDPRGWGLFRLAHHRLQKQQLAYRFDAPLAPPPPAPPSGGTGDDLLLGGQLDEQDRFVRGEADALRISVICWRGRELVARLSGGGPATGPDTGPDVDLSVEETMQLVREMHELDQEVVSWRRGPEWSFRTVSRDLIPGLDRARFALAPTTAAPTSVEIHRDVWAAYEWNYHRTARILMHQQLLACLRRAAARVASSSFSPLSSPSSPSSSADATAAAAAANAASAAAAADVISLLSSLSAQSTATIRQLADQILATVPQTLGDIDHTGAVLTFPSSSTSSSTSSPPHPSSRAIGAYLLLWPMKILKSPRSGDDDGDSTSTGIGNNRGSGSGGGVSDEQRAAAGAVFQRIRECTGMRARLGGLSNI